MKTQLNPNPALFWEVAYRIPQCDVDHESAKVVSLVVTKPHCTNYAGKWGVSMVVQEEAQFLREGLGAYMPDGYSGGIWHSDLGKAILQDIPSVTTRQGATIKNVVDDINRLNTLLDVFAYQPKQFYRAGLRDVDNQWLYTQFYGVLLVPIERVREENLWAYAVRVPDDVIPEQRLTHVPVNIMQIKEDLFLAAERHELLELDRKAAAAWCNASAVSWQLVDLPHAPRELWMEQEPEAEAVAPAVAEDYIPPKKPRASRATKAELLKALQAEDVKD